MTINTPRPLENPPPHQRKIKLTSPSQNKKKGPSQIRPRCPPSLAQRPSPAQRPTPRRPHRTLRKQNTILLLVIAFFSPGGSSRSSRSQGDQRPLIQPVQEKVRPQPGRLHLGIGGHHAARQQPRLLRDARQGLGRGADEDSEPELVDPVEGAVSVLVKRRVSMTREFVSLVLFYSC